MFTYRDVDRRRADACARALAVLDSDPDTLVLAGAIWKRRWEVEQRFIDLEQSAGQYLRGWECRRSTVEDCAIGANAAFVLDCLAAEDDQPLHPRGMRRPGPERLPDGRAPPEPGDGDFAAGDAGEAVAVVVSGNRRGPVEGIGL